MSASPSTELAPSPSPSAPAAVLGIPDLTPPRGGWVAFLSPEDCLTLASENGSRTLSLCQLGKVAKYSWSPNGDWLAYQTLAGPVGVISLRHSSAVTVGDGWGLWEAQPAWSEDSQSLVYFSATYPGGAEGIPSALALRVFHVASGQTLTVTTLTNLVHDGIPSLCAQPFPNPLLPLSYAGTEGGGLFILDVQMAKGVGAVDIAKGCSCLWAPGGKGLLFPRSDSNKKPILFPLAPQRDGHPTSLVLWKAGVITPTVLLDAGERQAYWPAGWLPDGRLEVRVEQYDKDTYYQAPAEPEHVVYRYFRVSEAGELREVPQGEVPWWAAGRFEALIAGEFPGEEGQVVSLHVGPDGKTVAFAWQSEFSADWYNHVAVYLWQGDGHPTRLAMGYDPHWQPVQAQR